MSGHSKWKTIKHRKGAADAKRGQLFTKIAKVIAIAAKEGGGDPEGNFKLRLAIEKAREANMPKDNIQRAIDRGIGKGEAGVNFKEIMYEGFGPQGTAFMVEVATDNTNRTNSELRTLFSKNGGNLGGSGSVSYLFESAGYLYLVQPAKSQDEALLELMEVEDIKDVVGENGGIEVYTKPEKLSIIKDIVTQKGYIVKEAELVYKPQSLIRIQEENAAHRLIEFTERIEDHDDVQKVHTNFDIDDIIIQNLGKE